MIYSDPNAVAQYIEALVVANPSQGANHIQQGKSIEQKQGRNKLLTSHNHF